MSPDSLQPVLTTKPLVLIDCLNKKGICLIIFRHLPLIFWRTGLLYLDFSA